MEPRCELALNAWLSAIAASGWRKATLESASGISGLPREELMASLGDKLDALAALQDQVAREAALGAASGANVRERLFDGMMQGFDHLQANRGAILAIWASRDPGVALLVAGSAGLQLRRLALASGMDVAGVRGHLRLAGLSALALKALSAWRADETPDMAATMAELDRLLERAERAETEGLSPDLLGLPGVTALFDRLRLRRDSRPARGGPALPPSPGPSAE